MAKSTNCIPANERGVAAKVFTVGNLAMDHYFGQCPTVSEAYRRANYDIECDCGCSADEELESWEDMVSEPGMLEMWEEKKAYLAKNHPDLKLI